MVRRVCLAFAFAAIIGLTGMFSGCRQPEYSARVEADPGVIWWGDWEVWRDKGRGSSRRGTRIPDQEHIHTPSWEQNWTDRESDGTPGRITRIILRAFKTAGEGAVRIEILRDGIVVAQDETSVIGTPAYCEFGGD